MTAKPLNLELMQKLMDNPRLRMAPHHAKQAVDEVISLRARVTTLQAQLADTKTMLFATAEAAATHLKQLAKALEALGQIAGFDYEHDDMEMQIHCANIARKELKDQSQ
jgi:hypothetical protein